MRVIRALLAPAILISALVTAANARISALESSPLLDVGPPPLGEAQWVAEQMRMNGLPMSVKTFSSRLNVDEVFKHYESWARTRDAAETERSRRGEWQILALMSERHFVTIQARSAIDGSEGTITVSELFERTRPNVRTRFPHPESARIVNLQQYEDHGVAAEHISLVSTRSVFAEAQAFSQLLSQRGWQLIRDERASTLIRGHVIQAQRGAEHVLLTLQPDQARSANTAILIVWRKS